MSTVVRRRCNRNTESRVLMHVRIKLPCDQRMFMVRSMCGDSFFQYSQTAAQVMRSPMPQGAGLHCGLKAWDYAPSARPQREVLGSASCIMDAESRRRAQLCLEGALRRRRRSTSTSRARNKKQQHQQSSISTSSTSTAEAAAAWAEQQQRPWGKILSLSAA